MWQLACRHCLKARACMHACSPNSRPHAMTPHDSLNNQEPNTSLAIYNLPSKQRQTPLSGATNNHACMQAACTLPFDALRFPFKFQFSSSEHAVMYLYHPSRPLSYYPMHAACVMCRGPHARHLSPLSLCQPATSAKVQLAKEKSGLHRA